MTSHYTKFNRVGPIHYISYHENNKIKEKILLDEKNEYHAENQPAITKFSKDGEIEEVYYYKHGELHNEIGPAVIFFDKDKNPIKVEYWFNGKIQ